MKKSRNIFAKKVTPGIVAAVMLSINNAAPPVWLLALAGANAIISLLAIFLCRGILNYAELKN